jgi:hypothetical protein
MPARRLAARLAKVHGIHLCGIPPIDGIAAIIIYKDMRN